MSATSSVAARATSASWSSSSATPVPEMSTSWQMISRTPSSRQVLTVTEMGVFSSGSTRYALRWLNSLNRAPGSRLLSSFWLT